LHEGEDSVDGAALRDKTLTPYIYCGRRGIVVDVAFDARGYGDFCIVDFGDGWRAWYCHMKQIDVNVGQIVMAKQVLGIMGATGNATGPHCHLTLQHIGYGLHNYVVPDVVDPADYLVAW
jgi:murein DD-endopeptidase MepM/ murein hydrolase activator NlpD